MKKPVRHRRHPGHAGLGKFLAHDFIGARVKMTKMVEVKSTEMEFAGDFVGTGKLTLEPTNGKTKVQYRWNVRPKRLYFVLLSPFVDLGKRHSHVMQKGFEALNSYLNKK